MCLASNRDLSLLHDFQQRTLHLGRCAVDFVGQQQVGKHRTQHGAEFTAALVEHARSYQVGRQQVGRELDAFENTLHRLCKRVDSERFG